MSFGPLLRHCRLKDLKVSYNNSPQRFFFVFRNKENDDLNLVLPFILKHCFKSIKQVEGSDKNVSGLCNLCSKVIKGSLTSTTNFLKHLKVGFFKNMHLCVPISKRLEKYYKLLLFSYSQVPTLIL